MNTVNETEVEHSEKTEEKKGNLLELHLMMTRSVNFALWQNGRPVIYNIVLNNQSSEPIEKIEIKITSVPELFIPFSQNIEFIPAGSSFTLRNPEIALNGEFLAALTEKIKCCLNIEVLSDGQTILTKQEEITALAYDEWHGSSVYPELLAAFVTPNHPEIVKLAARTAELLGEWTGDPSLDGYLSKDPNRVLKQVAAVYAALQEQNIVYSVPPASFESTGQRIRLCDAVIQQKMGTCLDLTLLYASVLEAIGLHPILLLKSDHAFLGVWLEELSLPEAVSDDPSVITKRLAEGINEIAVVECTHIRAGVNISFDESSQTAEKNLDDVILIIDVARARSGGVRPIPNRIKTDEGWKIERPELPADKLTAAPKEVMGAIDVSTLPDTLTTRKLQWERKLLDLGLRNSLINLRRSKTLVPLMTSSLDNLEDALSDRKDFSILPRPADWKTNGELDFSNLHHLEGFETVIKSEFQNHRLRSSYTEAELTRSIKELYRSSKHALEENGANALYLALGLLKWYETPKSTKERYAPILLIPVEMVRKSAAEGYIIRLRDDDPQMNITILEKLKQDFGITVGGLDPLPQDEHGIDTRMVFTIMRKAIMSQKNWDILESAYLGIFSFSQFVMWNDLKNRSDDLARNKIVQSLMEGRLTWQAEEMEIGKRVPEDNVFLPLPADASQLYAIEAATKGESFVLHGPPGTGKSQTITTLIANALAHGRTVLFVAEKMAALEVVQKRLEKIGLGAFCLELHSNKSKKKDVLEQLRRASEVTKEKSAEEYAERAEQISVLRAELDDYANALHKKLRCGKDTYEIINEYEKFSGAPDIEPFSSEFADSMTSLSLADRLTIVQRLAAAAISVGQIENNPLLPIRAEVYSQQLKIDIPKKAAEYMQSVKTVLKPLEQLSDMFEISSDDFQSALRLARLSMESVNWFDMPMQWAKEENIYTLLAGVKDMCSRHLKLRAKKAEMLKSWKPDYLSLDGTALLEEYREASSKWLIPKAIGINAVLKKISSYALKPVTKDDIEGCLTALAEFKKEEKEASRLYDRYGYTLAMYDMGEGTDWSKVFDITEKALLSAEALAKISGGESFRTNYCGNVIYTPVINELNGAWSDFIEKRFGFYELLDINADERNVPIAEEIDFCENILNHIDEMKEWMTWNGICKEAENAGLSNVVNGLKNGLSPHDAESAYRKAAAKILAIRAIDSEPALNRFSGALFNEKIEQFSQLDKQLTKLTQEEIFCRLAAKIPSFAQEAAKSSELGILQKAIRSGGRGVSIRKLFEQIPNMLPRLCPCMLMSPISAAQYLDPNREPFDIVVFDEASQLQTCKAIGALARGNNAVIVGDPKQMPPTSFFSSNQIDEDNLDIEDLESILDDCLALNMPQTHLLWHYRSRHESLIAFSNNRFYENKLYTFPSVNDREAKVRLVHVDGIFERGKGRCNRAEAEAVVEDLKRRSHDKNMSELSVGVVTFNINQQNLIDDLLTEACKTDPVLEAWAYSSKEPLFIKNLENVQGDERDVILFSVGYGPDEEGRVSMNFGPLNRDGGWRRLNVAVSRARCEMTVYSTLTPDMINLSRTSAEGVAALRAFLEYASGKNLGEDENTVKFKKADVSGIADTICRALAEKGYSSEKMVGHSEYRIDIGIVDPDDPEKYILGILLDGAGYGSSKTTRDRELAQISILEGLGWRIMRVWSMDWWDNSQKELSRIFAELDRIRNLAEAAAGEGESLI
ncbi:MAG: DUF4011 domain-containing protein [Clostridia bacterium]|nr:DUF4011 domain-containing protein [Clostridia bacterium]